MTTPFQELNRVDQILAVNMCLLAADALNNMGFIMHKHVVTMYELDVAQVIYEDDLWDCPCCQADYMDADYYLALLTGHDDNFADAYERSPREKARDRAYRNRYRGDTREALRGYKSRGRVFKQ